MESFLKHWKLVGKTPVECGLFEWAEFFETERRFIKYTEMPLCRVSTIFIGLDQSVLWGPGSKRPILFESMIRGGSLDGEQWRYATYEEAEEGHKQLCGMAGKATQSHAASIMISIIAALLVWLIFD